MLQFSNEGRIFSKGYMKSKTSGWKSRCTGLCKIFFDDIIVISVILTKSIGVTEVTKVIQTLLWPMRSFVLMKMKMLMISFQAPTYRLWAVYLLSLRVRFERTFVSTVVDVEQHWTNPKLTRLKIQEVNWHIIYIVFKVITVSMCPLIWVWNRVFNTEKWI